MKQWKQLIVPIGVVLIVLMMVLPLPTWLLSFLLIINLSLALTIVLVAMFTREPLQFSIFPSLLLITTLFRLSLNVSTTRSILKNGDAGQVIEAFGQFVVGADPVIGFIVFIILVIIQFVVITKGSERVAEVAARFTLDAMPGKQMSIDADLNAGLITEQQARERRRNIEREADFYGAMDGASKFVKGDAIVGIIILIINVIGGLIIGMVYFNLSIRESAERFTLLSVGDGLVSQIPALLISTATGIIVTRAASDGNLSEDITSQIFAYPKLLYVVAATIAILGLTPIGPITFPIAGVLAFGGYKMQKAQIQELSMTEQLEEEKEIEQVRSPENIVQLLQIDPIEFEFGYGLIPLADANQGGDLLDRVIMIRRQIALELGLMVPVVRIRDNIQLKPNQYVIKIKGNKVAEGDILLDHYLAMNAGIEDDSITGIQTVEPAFGLPALWINDEMREQAEMAGYTVVDAPSVVATHLTEVIKKHSAELLGRQEVKTLIDHVKESQPALVDELVPNLLTVGEIQKVLANLLKEKISIRNLVTIFETLADYATYSKDPGILTEYVRQSLSRQITLQYTEPNQPLKVITIGPGLEKKIAESVQHTDQGSYLAIDPNTSQLLYKKLNEQVSQLVQIGQQPIILTSPMTRMYVRQFVERMMPELPILSYNELEPYVEVQSVGVVNI
ncbi:flagellar biosynthesis protein FlhA [Tepidibacillus infernus]|uniref:Flagellar biosynthesis protein FlhA n=1 Tax=Tepidibacillus decaturensis TaxID=1413211 RepID=A0A135L3H3_9BACI|nr:MULTISPECIES: flagellar biosynthesis protein FlhA [Tepidibacillus]KXG43403.1 EscV/YscV/HrcV family type III secretion system export apparatus protein [Tepidibacillus decaturensis]GBF11618.1 flagellar biosynthesis protein FlhA [Tepidibacillus sp. HK-1]